MCDKGKRQSRTIDYFSEKEHINHRGRGRSPKRAASEENTKNKPRERERGGGEREMEREKNYRKRVALKKLHRLEIDWKHLGQ